MSRKWTTLFLSGVVFIGVCAAIFISRASTESRPAKSFQTQTRTIPTSRNLSLQPEAARVNRRLGNRFIAKSGPESTLTGILTLGTTKQQVTIVRRQTINGETVDTLLPDQPLTWSDAGGVTATSGSATQAQRALVEKLIFDSPDQFVFAQLRGASYHTISRNLRPNDAGENYRGPLWTLVRVAEPRRLDDMGQTDRWRLYYINETTQLIDRVVSEQAGQTIEATIQWAEWNGEQVPSHIKWTANGQPIMDFEVATFSLTK